MGARPNQPAVVRARHLEHQPVVPDLLQEAAHRDRLAGVDRSQVPYADLVAHGRVTLGQVVLDRSVGGELHEHDHGRRGEHASPAHVTGHQRLVHDTLEASLDACGQGPRTGHAVHCVE